MAHADGGSSTGCSDNSTLHARPCAQALSTFKTLQCQVPRHGAVSPVGGARTIESPCNRQSRLARQRRDHQVHLGTFHPWHRSHVHHSASSLQPLTILPRVSFADIVTTKYDLSCTLLRRASWSELSRIQLALPQLLFLRVDHFVISALLCE